VLEPEVALLDEVEQLHARRHGVAARHAHNETEVGADEAVLGCGRLGHLLAEFATALTRIDTDGRVAAPLDDLGEFALL